MVVKYLKWLIPLFGSGFHLVCLGEFILRDIAIKWPNAYEPPYGPMLLKYTMKYGKFPEGYLNLWWTKEVMYGLSLLNVTGWIFDRFSKPKPTAEQWLINFSNHRPEVILLLLLVVLVKVAGFF
jgi:hypothetical protein